MSEPTQFSREETKRIAAETLANYEFLEKRPEFAAFKERLRREADGLADQILHNDEIAPEKREAMRNKRLGLLAALAAPTEDMQACRNVMKGS